jgi:murein DD-endopeptidase MepM/ murein hydrolase activator NlpD
MHLDEIHLSVDNQVTKGTVIGKTGQRGQNNRFAFAPHLHYEVSRNLWGALQNPAAQTKQQFRERSYNPLKIYWEMRRNG